MSNTDASTNPWWALHLVEGIVFEVQSDRDNRVLAHFPDGTRREGWILGDLIVDGAHAAAWRCSRCGWDFRARIPDRLADPSCPSCGGMAS